jgi:hypothetical protein
MSVASTTLIRNLDAQAYARLKATKIVYDPDPKYRQEWVDILNKVGRDARATLFTPAFFDRVLSIAAPQI